MTPHVYSIDDLFQEKPLFVSGVPDMLIVNNALYPDYFKRLSTEQVLHVKRVLLPQLSSMWLR
jgi:hypothetical protein